MVFAIKVRLKINSKISPYSYVTNIEIPARLGDNSYKTSNMNRGNTRERFLEMTSILRLQ